jgi:hypothetical protein
MAITECMITLNSANKVELDGLLGFVDDEVAYYTKMAQIAQDLKQSLMEYLHLT